MGKPPSPTKAMHRRTARWRRTGFPYTEGLRSIATGSRQAYREAVGEEFPKIEGMALSVPARLAANCGKTPARAAWLERLLPTLGNLQQRWSLSLGAPFDCDEVSCAWVAPVTRADGTAAVLKLGMPHMEAEHEIQALTMQNSTSSIAIQECVRTRTERSAASRTCWE
jgi:hypothetical protein